MGTKHKEKKAVKEEVKAKKVKGAVVDGGLKKKEKSKAGKYSKVPPPKEQAGEAESEEEPMEVAPAVTKKGKKDKNAIKQIVKSKKKEASSSSSSSSDSSESDSEDDKPAPKSKPSVTTPTPKAAAKTKKAQKSSSSESESEEEKPKQKSTKQTPVAKKQTKGETVKPAKAVKVEAKKAKQQAKKSESSSESDSEEDEKMEEEVKKPSKKKAQAPAKQAKKESSESSEEDSDDEEDKKPQPKKDQQKAKAAAPSKKAVPAKKQKEEASSEDDSDSDEEEDEKKSSKKPQQKTKPATPTTSKKATPAEKSDSSEEDSSEEEVEKKPAKKAAEKAPPAKKVEKKESSSSSSEEESDDEDSKAKKPVKGAGKAATAQKPAKAKESSSEEESESESEEEEKPVKASGAKKTTASKVKVTAVNGDKESSDEESDSDEEMETEKAKGKKEESSSEEDSSEDEEEKPAAKSKKQKDKAESEDSEEDSSEDDEEEESVGLLGKRKKQADTAKATPAKKARSDEAKTPQENGESNTLFVGNLSFNIGDEDLSEFFSSEGHEPSSARVITRDGQSRGYGYVEFSSSQLAKKAIDGMNGAELDGRQLRLDFATPRGGDGGGRGTPRGGRGGRGGTPRGGRGGRGGGRGGGPGTPSNRLFVGNLCYDTEQSSLQAIFPEATDVFIPMNRDTGKGKGFGFVTFEDTTTAEKMMKKKDGSEIDGFQISLKYAQERNRDGGGGGGGGACRKCGEEGHFARDCPQGGGGGGGGGACHKCGEEGHFARECPQGGGGGGGGACHKCGEEGHFARECPQGGGGGGACHKCGEEGHFARECPKAGEIDENRPAPVTYVPPAPAESEEEMFRSIERGINFDKYDEIPVEVTGRGKETIIPIQGFDQAQLFETFQENVRKAKYTKPTPVQKYAIPTILAGRDLMACAQTGSGKTAAFLLPVMTGMLQSGLTSSAMTIPQCPQALCVSPTRELASQIYNEARKFAHKTMLRPVVAYGGVSVSHQLRQIENGCNLLVATPGRLLDFVEKGKVSLKSLQYLILDEADRMLDMGFEPSIRKLVENMGMPEKTERQTLMFSATFPEEIQRLAGDFLNDYIFLTVGRVGGTTSDIQQTVMDVPEDQKREKLTDLLSSSGTDRTLVFVESKRGADFLASLLSQEGFPTTSIHGDRQQQEREEALADFRKGRCPVLIATNVAARGLDIDDVKHVVNYDLPSEIDEFVHRVGRTGRIGHQGKATSFFQQGKDDKIARALVKVLSDASQEVPEWLEEIAESAVGTSYGPAGGRFASRDTRRQYEDSRGGGGGGDSGWGGDWNSEDTNSQVNGTAMWSSNSGGGDEEEW